LGAGNLAQNGKTEPINTSLDFNDRPTVWRVCLRLTLSIIICLNGANQMMVQARLPAKNIG